jgi:hypothetical protein
MTELVHFTHKTGAESRLCEKTGGGYVVQVRSNMYSQWDTINEYSSRTKNAQAKFFGEVCEGLNHVRVVRK